MTTSTIGTSGRNYSTCKAWADAADATLTAEWRGECYNDATITESNIVYLDSTQTADYRMILTTATGQSFADHADKLTNALQVNQAKGVMVDIGNNNGIVLTNFAILEKLQIVQSGSGNVFLVQGSGSGSTMSDFGIARRLVLLNWHGTGGASDGMVQNNRMHAVNIALISYGSNSNGIKSGAGTQGRISACTVLCTNGSSSGTGISTTADVFGCATFGFGADNTVGASSSNNATNRSSFGGGSSNQTSLTTANEIENASGGTEDLRAKATGNLDGNGVRDQTYTSDLDIVGQSRSTTTPTIGAWEVVAGGAVAEGGGMLLGSRRNRLTIP